MWVEDDEAAGRVHERRVGEAQREVVGFAQQKDQVAPAEHLGERAQARIVDAARALHADARARRRDREPARSVRPATVAKRGAGQDQRSLGAGERGERRIGRGIAERAHLGHELRRAWQEIGAVLESLLEQIEREAQMHGPGTARLRKSDRAGEVVAQRLRGARGPGRLRRRLRHVGLAQLLEGAAAELARRRHVPTAARAANWPPSPCTARRRHWPCPGPPVTSAMPHSPVRRAQASAMCTAAASWRTCTSFRPVPIAASKTGMM